MKILRLPETEIKAGLKHSEIYRRMKLGTFPKQVRLGKRAVGWLESEIDQWIEALASQRAA